MRTFADMKSGRVRLFFSLGVVALCVALGVACARVLAPEGGPKDVTPPKLLRAKPEAFTLNFSGNEVRLYFDEMVSTKELQKELQVSPPLKYPVTPVDKGKTVVLKFKDTLRANTTYRFDLSGAIVDFAEGNKATNCVYVFSTGQQIDSGLVVGNVRDAFTHNPIENAAVQLYTTASPRAAVDSFPNAAARTNKDGSFRVENLPLGDFQVVALVDVNTNRKYDLPTEQIAFLDTLMQAIRMPVFVDTLGRSDSAFKATRPSAASSPADSVASLDSALVRAQRDSLLTAQRTREEAARVLLNVFTYARPKQVLQKRERPEAGMVRLVFSCPPEGEVRVETVAPAGISFVEERSAQGDTILLWAKDELTRSADTLFLHVHSLASDSLYRLQPWVDTLRLGYKVKKTAARARKSKRDEATDTVPSREPLKLEVLDAKRASAIKPNDTLTLRTQHPYASLDSTKFRLVSNADTAEYPFTLVRLEGRPRDLGITARWPVDSSFTMVVDSGAFRSYLGDCNDSVAFSWRTYRPSEYSALHFTLVNVPKPCILQLYTDEKEKKTVREVIARGDDTLVSIRYLPPGAYYLRIVHDRNGDGKWTTGDFEKRRQPEPVRYFVTEKGENVIKVRANWEYDINVDYSILEE